MGSPVKLVFHVGKSEHTCRPCAKKHSASEVLIRAHTCREGNKASQAV